MPDVSVISELCEILSVSSNELLAGEQLDSAESFSKKAEENIMEAKKEMDSTCRHSGIMRHSIYSDGCFCIQHGEEC